MGYALFTNRVVSHGVAATVTVTSQTGGTASGGGATYTGRSVTVVATPSSGYNFIGWYKSSVCVSNDMEYTFIVDGNVTLNARFSQSERSPGNITITPTEKTVNASTPILTSSDATAYSFVEGDGYAAETVQFTATVGSAGIPDNNYTYQWYMNDKVISGATNSTYTTVKLRTAGTFVYYCTVSNGVGKAAESNRATVTVNGIDWKIKITKSTSITFSQMPTGSVDLFMVGGGGSGVRAATNIGGDNTHGGGGGCGGFTTTSKNISVAKGQAYQITIGSGGVPSSDGFTGGNGGNTYAFGQTAMGGSCGATSYGDTGSGGSGGGGHGDGTNPRTGGDGGYNGSDGKYGTYKSQITFGAGQGKTTREFGESTGTLYAGGGGGACGAAKADTLGDGGKGGSGGGGNGAGWSAAKDGKANTGGGGGGACRFVNTTPGSGGSGVVIIRNHRG